MPTSGPEFMPTAQSRGAALRPEASLPQVTSPPGTPPTLPRDRDANDAPPPTSAPAVAASSIPSAASTLLLTPSDENLVTILPDVTRGVTDRSTEEAGVHPAGSSSVSTTCASPKSSSFLTFQEPGGELADGRRGGTDAPTAPSANIAEHRGHKGTLPLCGGNGLLSPSPPQTAHASLSASSTSPFRWNPAGDTTIRSNTTTPTTLQGNCLLLNRAQDGSCRAGGESTTTLLLSSSTIGKPKSASILEPPPCTLDATSGDDHNHAKKKCDEQFLSRDLPTRYRYQMPLGKGGCGTVWSVERTADGKVMAAKVVRLSNHNVAKRRFALEEPMLMSMCDSAFIVRCIDHWTDNETAVVTVMELIDGVDLYSHIRRLRVTAAHHLRQARRLARGLPELPAGATFDAEEDDYLEAQRCELSPLRMQQLEKKDPMIRYHLKASMRRAVAESSARILLVQMLVGLHHIHSKGIVHCDIKAGNAFLCNTGLVKIGDFGLSCLAAPIDAAPQQKVSPTRPAVIPFLAECSVGTPCYMAPELWCTEGMPPYSVKSDMWALGVVVFEILTGHRPFPRGSTVEVGTEILRREPANVLRYAPETSPAMVSLVQSLMHPDPACRPTAWEALQTPLMRLALSRLLELIATDSTIPVKQAAAATEELRNLLPDSQGSHASEAAALMGT